MNYGFFIQYVSDAEVIHVHQETPKAVYNRYKREAMAFKNISAGKFQSIKFLSPINYKYRQ